MKKINVTQQQKIQFSLENSSQSVEIGNTAIEAGLLRKLPGACLSIFLYLVTHIEKNNVVLSNPTIISNYLPFNLKQIKEGLEHLEARDFIEIDEHREGNYNYRIYLKLEQLSFSPDNNNVIEFKDKQKLRQHIINNKSVSRQELEKALFSFFPNNKNPNLIQDNIKQWLSDFEPPLIQELIRRVNKWEQNYNKSLNEVFYYLQGIIDDWYLKEIFTYDKLKHFDQLFRETREIAAAYGLKQWQNINQFQIETFKSWLNDDFPLSTSVIKYAIKKAIKRKRDGKPSLQYIEDNYIIPWKKAGIKNTKEAKKFLHNKRFQSNKNHNLSQNKSVQNNNKKEENRESTDWNYFPWEIEQLI